MSTSTARGLAPCALLLLLAACGGESDPGADAGTSGPREIGPVDATIVDLGPQPDDLGVRIPDAGFADPSIIAQGRQNIEGPLLFVTVRGTLTSTMPPLIVLPTGPSHGQEYLFGPTEFLLGPGGVENPDRLIVYMDSRATGRSSFGAINDAEVTVENHLKDLGNLVEYVDQLVGGAPQVDFLGHGYGAGLATLYAAQNPTRVSRMVLSNPFPSKIDEHARWNENYLARLNAAETERLNELTDFRICFQDIKLCSNEWWFIIGPTWICRENTQAYRSLDFQHIDFRAFGFFIARDLRNNTYDWTPQMGLIRSVPTTIISGPCDPIPADTPLAYTSSIAGSVHHVVDGTGHFTMAERPNEWRQIVKRALTY